ncbi:MAG TPA: hypothetical protein VEZ90_02510, partial [Blastocatellia bacterium]|nr:hypothetical protein [Blastocatellia bacterium]
CGPVTPNRPIPLLRKLNGPVVNVDPEKGIVEIKPPGSQNPVKFFVPQTAGAQKQMLKGIKPGDKLQVTTLLPGRAEKFEKSS